ncbi:ABC transporter ATP-binding protein [Pseudoluteimonas lycopersici]|uniref:ABC transporter ATP-binding protein n=1 Tax=Pseudoluteimonas lycopersici TaxID=1324796 RepID=A0A516V7B6_9GAMM|nr:ABC transporter ATP-binding protein [Lysobacter lycopersici]QDQ74415.1 ABC transporter ATP-binding protein [Lysobacter lycopersici]
MHLEASNLTIDFPVRKGPKDPFDFDSANIETGGTILAIDGKPHVRALDDISFALGAGDRLGLVGHNGSGKSTLLRALCGIYHPSHGEVRSDHPVSGIFNVQLGFRIEASGYRNILLKGLVAGRSRPEIEAAVPGIAEFAGLGPYLHMPMHTYSQGMAMRLAFAITTAFANHILVMDEWIGAGDANFQNKVVERMDSFFESADICVIASHNNRLLRQMTNQCLWLDGGKARALGPTADVLDAYEAEATALRLKIARQAALDRPRIAMPPEHRAMWIYQEADNGQRASGHVLAWDVAEFNVTSVSVTVQKSSGAEQTVCTGRGTGTKLIGPWLQPGMTFALHDNVDGMVLARLEFPG